MAITCTNVTVSETAHLVTIGNTVNLSYMPGEPKKSPHFNLHFIIYEEYRHTSYMYLLNILFLNEISFACRVFKIKLCAS